MSILTNQYIAKLKESGVPLLVFNCPHCHVEIETQKNITHNDWDSIASCPSCNKMFLKITPAKSEHVLTKKEID